jgi:IS30 family transposase
VATTFSKLVRKYKIKGMHERGYRVCEIAKELGISQKTVWRELGLEAKGD